MQIFGFPTENLNFYEDANIILKFIEYNLILNAYKCMIERKSYLQKIQNFWEKTILSFRRFILQTFLISTRFVV